MRKFDTSKTLLMISLYPKRGELYSEGTSGVASYAKNVATHINSPVVVLADWQTGQKKYEEENVLVWRCFKRNTIKMWAQILFKLLAFSNIKKVCLQFDFAVYGNIVTTLAVLPFLAILKLLGYQTNVVMHHVIVDVAKLSGHLGLGKSKIDRLKGRLYSLIFSLFYKLLALCTYRIIVLEEALKTKLSQIIPASKIMVIPHGVDTELTPVSQSRARSQLRIDPNEYVVLFFGFVNWFKGADFFVHAYKDIKTMVGKKVRFILAGGESPTMKERSYYREYFDTVTTKVQKSKRIEITGYIKGEDIATYFAAADLIVLPYRHFMTASGVLSLVFSYKKPFILSESLGEMVDATDFQQAFKSAGLLKGDFIFKLNADQCVKTTKAVLKNGIKHKMVTVAEVMRHLRSYKNTASLYEKALALHTPYHSLALHENNQQ